MWVPRVPMGILEPPEPRLLGHPHHLLDLGAPRRPVNLLVSGEAAPRPPLSLPNRELRPMYKEWYNRILPQRWNYTLYSSIVRSDGNPISGYNLDGPPCIAP